MRFAAFLAKNLFRRKMRSVLTAAGVAIAVGTTVALLGISDGFERSSVESFETRGVDIVVVAEGVLDQLNSDLDERCGQRILALPGVRAIAPGIVDLVEYSKEGTVISLMVQGWDPESFLLNDLEIVAGHSLRRGHTRHVMLGVTLAQNIDKTVGDTVTIQRESFEVVGIFQSFSVYENGSAVFPLRELQDVMVRAGSVTGFSVVLDKSPRGEVAVEETCQAINSLLDEEGEPLGMSAMPTKQYVDNSMHIRMAHSMARLTSAIAIVVGAIGILNTMLMSVVERVREISILRAIGWRKSRVVRMIVGESCLLTLAGAVLGTLGAIALTRWLTTLPEVSGFIRADIAPAVIAKGLLMAAVVALIGGTYPAYQATRLSPSEGLRHE